MQPMHEQYMRRCFQLASNGLGRTSPNPLVGCVIVKDHVIVSEGYHQMHGQNHAERNAILRYLHNHPDGKDLKGATLYVNLEPCSHQGLTPPCADLIVESGIAEVVCCNDDPNPKVAGRGFAKLEAANIKVVRHILEAEGRFLNRRFFTFMEQQRPYIILKWAQSADGFMAANNKPYWISNQITSQLSHKWRTEEAAILVGAGTVRDDNPTLTTRLWSGKNPTRIVLGGTYEKSLYHIFDNQSETLHYHKGESLQEIMTDLFNRKQQSVIVEGGRQVLDQLLAASLWDEIRVVTAPKEMQEGLPSPSIKLEPDRTLWFHGDRVDYYFHKR